MIWTILGAVAIIYVLVLVFVYFAQSKMVYFPSRLIHVTPEAAGLAFDDVILQTEDGISIHGWFVPADSARGTLLFCHGNAGNISNRIESIVQFNRMRLNVFIFDYRGYGQSEGTPGEKGTYRDARAAWKYLTGTRSMSPDSIIIFGRSLGGAIASQLATIVDAKALIIESAFTSIPDVGAEHYPFLPVRLMSRFKYNTRNNLTKIKIPVLVVHSPQDDIIPFEHGRRNFAAAHEPRQFLEIIGSHNDGFIVSGDQYEKGYEEFLSNYLRE